MNLLHPAKFQAMILGSTRTFLVSSLFRTPLQFWGYQRVRWKLLLGSRMATLWFLSIHFPHWAWCEPQAGKELSVSNCMYEIRKREKEMVLAYFKTKDMKMAALLSRKKISFSYILTAKGGYYWEYESSYCQLLLVLMFKKKLWKPREGILIKFKFGMSLPRVDE